MTRHPDNPAEPSPTIGVISVGLPKFDADTARDQLRATREHLARDYEVVGPEDIVSEAEALERALPTLRTADVLLLQIGTFPDGNGPARLAQAVDLPTIVHTLPEPSLARDVPINSLCGGIMTTYTMAAIHRPYAFVHGDPATEEGRAALDRQVRAAGAFAELSGQIVGLLGHRAQGFYPATFDELALLDTFGVRVTYRDLHGVAQRLAGGERRELPHESFPTIEGGELDEETVRGMATYYAAVAGEVEEGGFDLIALRDWPEVGSFEPDLKGGVWPAMTWLQDDGVDVGAEGDVNGAVTLRVAHALSGRQPFFADIVAFDDDRSTLTLWHYGGSLELARDPSEVRFGADGTELEFSLRPGRGHLLRLGQRDGELRLLSVAVEVLDERVTLRRGGGTVRTERPVREVLDTIVEDGWEHHVILAYGELEDEIRGFASQAGIELTLL